MLMANGSEWAWSSIYFGVASAANVLVVLLSVALLVWWAASRWLPRESRAATAVLIGILLWSAYRILAPHVGTAGSGPLLHWIILAAIGAGALWIARRIDENVRERLAWALTVASLLFVAVTPIKAMLMSLPDASVFRLAWLPAEIATRNTLVVLFDEMSPEFTDPLVAQLGLLAGHVQYTTLPSTGKNTVNVIPAMLTGKRFDDFQPCGTKVLCSSRWALDMAHLHAPPGRVDIIGFHMPYCDIADLRSCSMIPWARLDPIRLGRSLVCTILAELGCEAAVTGIKSIAQQLPGLSSQASRSPKAQNSPPWRAEFTHLLAAAPFWREGGLLYLHVPLPHLPTARPSNRLKEDYAANMLVVEEVTAELIQRLAASFGERYTLILTSDHPLRVDMYCKMPPFAGPSCADSLPANHGQVPFIVASPVAIGTVKLETNLGLLQ